jgi:outer membrane protein OmpA-like peptidoglycan-associated protein
MTRARHTRTKYVTGVLLAGAIGIAHLSGCGITRHAPAGGRGGAHVSMDDLSRELSAIEGTRVERTGGGIEVTLDSETLFGEDSAMLEPASQRTIEEIADVLARYPGTRIAVSAYTDSIGPREYKRKMTERQALAIGEYFVDVGIPPSRIETRGYGALHTVASNTTSEGRRANRRVEIAIVPETGAKTK